MLLNINNKCNINKSDIFNNNVLLIINNKFKITNKGMPIITPQDI